MTCHASEGRNVFIWIGTICQNTCPLQGSARNNRLKAPCLTIRSMRLCALALLANSQRARSVARMNTASHNPAHHGIASITGCGSGSKTRIIELNSATVSIQQAPSRPPSIPANDAESALARGLSVAATMNSAYTDLWTQSKVNPCGA